MMSHDEASARLGSIRARIQARRAARETTHPTSNPSPRTPQYDTRHNEADNLERDLRADGHRCWGFVVYRTTYADDAAWRVCCERIRAQVHDSLAFYNGLDLLAEDTFKLTIVEDAARLDEAGRGAVGEHFRQWRAEALHREQGSGEEIAARRQSPALPVGSLAVRYRFCLQIDQDSLQSIITAVSYGDAWLRIVNCDIGNDDEQVEEEDDEDEDEDEDEDPEDRRLRLEEEDEERSGFPELEGSRAKDVRWMKVQLDGLMPGFYHQLHDNNAWDRFYQRPPAVAHG